MVMACYKLLIGALILIQHFLSASLTENENLQTREPDPEPGYGYYSNKHNRYNSPGGGYNSHYDHGSRLTSEDSGIIDHSKAQPKSEQNIADQCFQNSAPRCNQNSKYRTLDGTCNNLKKPWWGSVNTAHVRLMRPHYIDGVREHRLSVVDNSELPSARLLSTVFLPDNDVTDVHTRIYLQFSQLVAHDVTLNPQKQGPNCCSASGDSTVSTSGICKPIPVPDNDPFFSRNNRKCLEYRESETVSNCSAGALQMVVQNTHFIDASFVYGPTNEKAQSLRSRSRGHLRTRQVNGKDYLPTTNQSTCPLARKSCYDAGDPRVNQQIDLAVTQTMMLRFHNYIAERLIEMNRNWASNDELVYQEARRIVIGVFQHITYNEWLPILIGRKYAANVGLTPRRSGHHFGYNDNINPSTLADFAAGAFRGLHSLIPGFIELASESRITNAQLPYTETLQRPGDYLEEGDTYDSTLRGLSVQPQQYQDHFFTKEITDRFIGAEARSRNFGTVGVDLAAIDIQRGRNFGLSPYVYYRELCGLNRGSNFGDINNIDSEQLRRLSEIYKAVEDVDYYIGGLLESTISGTLSSPSFRCVFAEAFYRYKYGDRYFYDNRKDNPGAFTRDQLDAIKSFTLSHLICIGGDNIARVQSEAFYRPGGSNALVSCSSLIANLDLSSFQE